LCHVDANGTYTHATIFDYPSIGQIRNKILENQIFVIFAVTKDQKSLYERLSKELEPLSVTEIIDEGVSITRVITREYNVNTILSRIQLMLRIYCYTSRGLVSKQDELISFRN